jgi:hypothetical protein
MVLGRLNVLGDRGAEGSTGGVRAGLQLVQKRPCGFHLNAAPAVECHCRLVRRKSSG